MGLFLCDQRVKSRGAVTATGSELPMCDSCDFADSCFTYPGVARRAYLRFAQSVEPPHVL